MMMYLFGYNYNWYGNEAHTPKKETKRVSENQEIILFGLMFIDQSPDAYSSLNHSTNE